MLPKLAPQNLPSPECQHYMRALDAAGFRGDKLTDFASRVVASTDNSIYQFVPQAILAPSDEGDVVKALELLDRPQYKNLSITARGGGTGTNGQSLSHGIILDLSKYLTQILEVNWKRLGFRVQPGVVLDVLNRRLKRRGMMFGPTLSTSNRATLGGMIQTDAAGKGSRVYGKTSENVLSLRTVLPGGECWTSCPLSEERLETIKKRQNRIGKIHRVIDEILERDKDEIERIYPDFVRFITGYNLKGIRQSGHFDLNALIAGSEGTLGVVVEAKLKIVPIPAHRTLVVLKYSSFEDALGDAEEIAPTQPSAIETMDENLLELVKQDQAYLEVEEALADPDSVTRAINLVEYAGQDHHEVESKATQLLARLEAGKTGAIGHYRTANQEESDGFWTLRKRSVGLLGNLPGRRKPVAFVEDCVVPPARLRAFVSEFRQRLDQEGLAYGIFGHVDVGCLHVRPALDLRDAGDFEKLQRISDDVAAMVQRYGGILWGEHGKGVRGQYNPLFFGERLTQAMREIKQAFDPDNQLNPFKLATPTSSADPLFKIDSPTRGENDRLIPDTVAERFDDVIRCNGNGQCHDDLPDTLMCPSWKQTRNRIHTPKGRASLMREWLIQIAKHHDENETLLFHSKPVSFWQKLVKAVERKRQPEDLSHQVLEAMQGCLACKACSGQCPVKVDVPDFRAEFLQVYYDHYPRPIRDYLIAGLEAALPRMARLPGLFNLPSRFPVLDKLIGALTGMRDTPPLASPSLAKRLSSDPVSRFRIEEVDPSSICLVQDAMTTFYQPHLVESTLTLFRGLGLKVHLIPYFVNGKSMHVRGFVRRFEDVALRNVDRLRALQDRGARLVGLDPATTLTYRDEYPRLLGPVGFKVELLSEFLASLKSIGTPPWNGRSQDLASPPRYALLSHCTERALAPKSPRLWQALFASVGLDLELQNPGCCGMGGAYGHESLHRKDSLSIYQRSWRGLIEDGHRIPLVTGFSCYSQVKRSSKRLLAHPVEILAELSKVSHSPE